MWFRSFLAHQICSVRCEGSTYFGTQWGVEVSTSFRVVIDDRLLRSLSRAGNIMKVKLGRALVLNVSQDAHASRTQ